MAGSQQGLHEVHQSEGRSKAKQQGGSVGLLSVGKAADNLRIEAKEQIRKPGQVQEESNFQTFNNKVV
jgi:hypothetical protein